MAALGTLPAKFVPGYSEMMGPLSWFSLFGLAILGTLPGKCSKKAKKLMPKHDTKSKKINVLGVFFGVLGTLGGPWAALGAIRSQECFQNRKTWFVGPPQPEAKIGEKSHNVVLVCVLWDGKSSTYVGMHFSLVLDRFPVHF